MLDNEEDEWVDAVYSWFRLAAKQSVSWRDKLEFPFRRDVI
jgi:hypothetical protein